MPSLYVRDHKRVIRRDARRDAPRPGHQRVKRVIPRDTRRECHVTHPTKVFNYFLFIYAILIHKCFERPTVFERLTLAYKFHDH